MKSYLRLAGSLAALSMLTALISCDDEESVRIEAAPTIAVVSDNSEPYPGDKVNFSITVAAPGKLADVKLNGASIKTYTNNETEDTFTYEYTVPANATLGPQNLQFEVTDKQGTPLAGQFQSTLTIQNPDFRGSPIVLFDFQSAIPNNSVRAITYDQGGNSWENAYTLNFEVADPVTAGNEVLQADRKGAHEWYFQGGGAIFVEFANPLSEDDMEKLVSGERVLQMNMYFKEVPRLITAHKDPANVDGTKQDNVNVSWVFDYTNNPAVPNVPKVWSFEAQDSVQGGIPIAVELGNKQQWSWNNGFTQGKKFFLAGSIQQKNGWQTVTFSRRIGTIAEQNGAWVYTNYRVGTQESTAPAALQDPDVGLDQINYMALILNNRKTGFSNELLNPTSPWYDMPGDGNGWTSNNKVVIEDTHNTYLIDNIRTIDAVDFDKNPNL